MDPQVVVLTIVLFVVLLIALILVANYQNHQFGTLFNNKIKGDYQKIHVDIITLETRDMPLTRLHNESIQSYCDKHGYTYKFYSKFESKLPIYWQKLELLRQALDTTTADYVMWLDSDTFIRKPELGLETITLQDPTKSIIMGYDWPVLFSLVLNAGVIIIKNNQIGRDYLDDCLNSFINDPDCKDIKGNPALNGNWAGHCYEQGTMNRFWREKYRDHVGIAHKSLIFNGDFCDPDTFILHHFNCKKRAAICFDKYAKELNQ